VGVRARACACVHVYIYYIYLSATYSRACVCVYVYVCARACALARACMYTYMYVFLPHIAGHFSHSAGHRGAILMQRAQVSAEDGGGLLSRVEAVLVDPSCSNSGTHADAQHEVPAHRCFCSSAAAWPLFVSSC
jgi:hypothetical protein